jgi:hypothetical protein
MNMTNKEKAVLLALASIFGIYILPAISVLQIHLASGQQLQMSLLVLGALAPYGGGDVLYDIAGILKGATSVAPTPVSDSATSPSDTIAGSVG